MSLARALPVRSLVGAGAVALVVTAAAHPEPHAPVGDTARELADGGTAQRWYRGALHVHSLWSDGNDLPDSVCALYRDAGWDFVALTEHDTLPEGERWLSTDTVRRRSGGLALERHAAWFGPNALEHSRTGGRIRLPTLAEVRTRVAEPGHFLVLAGQEITDRADGAPVHVNAIGIGRAISKRGGASKGDAIARNLEAVADARRSTGSPAVGIVNHPNFDWALSPDDIAPVRAARFVGIASGHPGVHADGDETRPSAAAIWDAVNVRRIARGWAPALGVAVDDAHHYFGEPGGAHPLRAAVVVRAPELSADAVLRALWRGDFYATTGVELETLERADGVLALRVRAEPGASYVVRFIGARGDGVVRELARVAGPTARYVPRGDELFVRARVDSSLPVGDPVTRGERQRAWTQPLVLR